MFIPVTFLNAPFSPAAVHIAVELSHPYKMSAMTMERPQPIDQRSMVYNYAAVFSQSPGIARAWTIPGEGPESETLMVQRTARDLEGAEIAERTPKFEHLTCGAFCACRVGVGRL